MKSSVQQSFPRRVTGMLVTSSLVVALLGACGSLADDTVASVTASGGVELNLTSNQPPIDVVKDEKIAALVPQAVRQRGTLIIGQGSGTGSPPFSFPSTDNSSVWIGDEIDVGTAIAKVLGLITKFERSSWEGLFLGIDTGKSDVGVSNITVTEERKEKYDFATYREDVLSVIKKADSDLAFNSYADLAGKKIAVGSGTNQEEILVEYSDKLKAEGKAAIEISNFQDTTGVWTALTAGRIDGYFGPNPINAFHNAQVSGGADATVILPKLVSGGGVNRGLIAATTLKGNPLITAVHAALEKVLASGQLKAVLQRWGLADEVLQKSELNPPGLPKEG